MLCLFYRFVATAGLHFSFPVYPSPSRVWRDHSLQSLLQRTCINLRPLNAVYMAACQIMWGLHYWCWEGPSLGPIRKAEPKDMWVMVSQILFFFLVFSSSLSLQCIYWLPIGCRYVLLKRMHFLFRGLCFWLRSHQDRFPLADCIEHARTGSMLKIPLSCPSSPNDSSTLPRGNSSIMAGCLTGRGLMTGALYWPDCHTLKIWSQSSFFKTCQTIIDKLLFAQRVELAFSPF